MSRLDKLNKTQSLRELAHLLGYKPKSLSYILYKIPKEKKYVEFSIPKKNGEKRKINAPIDELKHLQQRLADLLNECFEEISKKSGRQKSLSHGFRKKHSIVTNAMRHRNRRYVFNVDLQDFFPSINFGRVRGFFIKNSHFNLEPKVATVIAQIACHNNELPQGSPCSPVISNLIGHLLDIRMVNLAKKTTCTYSRYADDLTFSTNKKEFPKKIAIRKNENVWTLGESLRREIEKVGFSVNDKKTSMQYETSRQTTTGLVVNEKVNIKKEYYRKARSMCNELFNTGEFYIDKRTDLTQNESESDNKVMGALKQLEGVLSFIYHIKRLYNNALLKSRGADLCGITKLYKEFLSYKHFVAQETPLVICEGKTDVIYLKCALKQLAKDYDRLAQVNDDGVDFKVRFLKVSRNLKDIFNISEGAPGLKNLMDKYSTIVKKFKGRKKHCPVIMLFDNDSGSSGIKNKTKDKMMNNAFFHHKENLYVLFAPKENEGEIEDLFDSETLGAKVEGKKFNRTKDDNKKDEYGKIVFAEKVIKARQNEIDFTGFKEIFDNFKLIMDDYSKKKSD